MEQNGKNGLIITKQELGKFTLKEAKQKCKTYTDNGSGWYLPSIEELELVYQNLKAKNMLNPEKIRIVLNKKEK